MNFLYKIYFSISNFSFLGILGKAINYLMRKFMKFYFDLIVPNYLKRTQSKFGYALNKDIRQERYIISLTSFPARIENIWITIETILRQNFQPDEIILWLDQKQFENIKLPQSLLDLKKRGLSIIFCDDVRSHTKYYYAIQKYPNANIITLDDDCYYPNDIVNNLIKLHEKFPKMICSNRVHKILFKNNLILPYRNWKHNCKDTYNPSHLLVQTGVSGVLYPPYSLNKEVFDKEVFKKYCYYADDLWLKLHSIRNNVKVVTSSHFNKDLICVSNSQKENLVSQNSFAGGNDSQFKDICNYYQIQIKEDI